MGACASAPAGQVRAQAYGVQPPKRGHKHPAPKVVQGPMIHTEVVNDVVATDEYGVFITCSDDKTIVRYDALKGQVLNVWKGHTRAVTRIVYGPKTKRVYSAGRDCHVYAWDTAYTKPLVKFEGHEFAVQAIALSDDERVLCTGGRDNTVRFWSTWDGQELSCTKVGMNVITGLRWIPGTDMVAQASEDLVLRIWSKSRPDFACASFRAQGQFQVSLDVSKCGKYLVSGNNGFQGDGAEVILWNRKSGKLGVSSKADGHTEAVRGAAFLFERGYLPGDFDHYDINNNSNTNTIKGVNHHNNNSSIGQANGTASSPASPAIISLDVPPSHLVPTGPETVTPLVTSMTDDVDDDGNGGDCGSGGGKGLDAAGKKVISPAAAARRAPLPPPSMSPALTLPVLDFSPSPNAVPTLASPPVSLATGRGNSNGNESLAPQLSLDATRSTATSSTAATAANASSSRSSKGSSTTGAPSPSFGRQHSETTATLFAATASRDSTIRLWQLELSGHHSMSVDSANVEEEKEDVSTFPAAALVTVLTPPSDHVSTCLGFTGLASQWVSQPDTTSATHGLICAVTAAGGLMVWRYDKSSVTDHEQPPLVAVTATNPPT